MAGIMKVAKEGLFSGLNHIKVQGILDEKYEEYFGFTQKETDEILNYYEMKYDSEKVKLWYDGYLFGNKNIYNPWSILNYIRTEKIEEYWINTADNELINILVKSADKKILEDFEKLLKNEEVVLEIKDFLNFKNFEDINSRDKLWQLCLQSGYLTIKSKEILEDGTNKCILKIPNKEILNFFKWNFTEKVFKSKSDSTEFIEYLIKGQNQELEKKLNEILLKNTSYNDFRGKELYYHAFMLGILIGTEKDYYVKSNRESGFGRYDLMLEPKNKSEKGIIIEFKISESKSDMKKTAEKAVNQILEKQYYSGLHEKGIKSERVIGISFYGKKAEIFEKEI